MAAYRPRIVEANEELAPSGAARRTRIGPTDRKAKLAQTSAVKAKAAKGGKQGVEQDIAPTEGRPLQIELGLVPQASGSALLTLGNTKVQCSVHGPRAIKRSADFGDEGTLTCTVRLAPFAQYHLDGLSVREADKRRIKFEQNLSSAVLRAIQASVRLERFPKSLLEVHVLVLNDDGGAQAASVTCASLALANSGVELFDLVPCANVGIGSSSFIVDPTQEQLKGDCLGSVTLALLSASEGISDLALNGPLGFDAAGQAVTACYAECARIHKLMSKALVHSASAEHISTADLPPA